MLTFLTALQHLSLPASLHDIMMARLDRHQPLKEVAQTAACIGREFSHGLLSSVWSRSEQELRDVLARLEEAELIFRRRGSPSCSTCSSMRWYATPPTKVC